MQIFDQHENQTISVESAIETVIERRAYGRADGELEIMRAKINIQSSLIAQLFEFIIAGDNSEDAKRAFLGEIVTYDMRIVD